MLEFSFLDFALFIVNAILIVCTVTILYLVHKFGTRTPKILKDQEYLPRVSIVIPTRNEELIIEERLKNIINMDYPRDLLEVIFVDDSNDKTQEIITKYKTRYNFIKLLKQDKPGFNNALNQGYGAATGEIVIKSDCDAFPLPDALRKIVANFADKSIGAVSGVCYFDSASKRMETLFRNIQTKFKLMEAYFHSALIFLGGFGAYRRNLIPRLAEEITADDSELVINVVKNGYRAIVDPSVKVRFLSPENFTERRKQLDRRAGGVIKVILKNARMLFNPKFGKFGLITMPIEFFILIAAPLLLLIDLVLIFAYAIMYHPYIAITVAVAIGLFFISAKYSILSRLLIDTYISCLHGITFAFSREKGWEKEEEGRQELLKTAIKS